MSLLPPLGLGNPLWKRKPCSTVTPSPPPPQSMRTADPGWTVWPSRKMVNGWLWGKHKVMQGSNRKRVGFCLAPRAETGNWWWMLREKNAQLQACGQPETGLFGRENTNIQHSESEVNGNTTYSCVKTADLPAAACGQIRTIIKRGSKSADWAESRGLTGNCLKKRE